MIAYSFIERFCTIVQYIECKSNIDIYSILKRPKLNGKIFQNISILRIYLHS